MSALMQAVTQRYGGGPDITHDLSKLAGELNSQFKELTTILRIVLPSPNLRSGLVSPFPDTVLLFSDKAKPSTF